MAAMGLGLSLPAPRPLRFRSRFNGSSLDFLLPSFAVTPRNLRAFHHSLRLVSAPRIVVPYVLCGRREHQIRAAIGEDDRSPSGPRASQDRNVVIACSVVTMVFAVANRVMYKLALVPLKRYPFFLAQFTTFGYVIIYFSILYARYLPGIATDEMLAVPKWLFMAIGMLEALGVASGMSAGD